MNYILLHGGDEPKLIKSEYYGPELHVPIPPEIVWHHSNGYEEIFTPLKYDTYEWRGKLWGDIDVYELKGGNYG
jgi:hypothetical protein